MRQIRQAIAVLAGVWVVMTAYLLIYDPPAGLVRWMNRGDSALAALNLEDKLTESSYQDDMKRLELASKNPKNAAGVPAVELSLRAERVQKAIDVENRYAQLVAGWNQTFMKEWWKFSVSSFVLAGAIYLVEAFRRKDSVNRVTTRPRTSGTRRPS